MAPAPWGESAYSPLLTVPAPAREDGDAEGWFAAGAGQRIALFSGPVAPRAAALALTTGRRPTGGEGGEGDVGAFGDGERTVGDGHRFAFAEGGEGLQLSHGGALLPGRTCGAR